MAGGYQGKIGFVNLTTGEITKERLDDRLAREYIGGYGLGVRILFERMQKGVDPLGPGNILGLTTGPLTGTKTPTGARYMAVCKSPLTGGWADANSGGYFGSELKSAGWDAIFFSGIASTPKYLMVTDDRLELRDASHLWGKDTTETEEMIQDVMAEKKLRVASIGPASEKLSLISGIVNDKGRVAARSGVGAVMGSKRLKAVAVYGTGKVSVADKELLSRLRKDFVNAIREMEGFPKMLRKHGTCALTEGLVASGATPIKNWLLSGAQAFPTLDRIADADAVIRFQKKKYGCANCPIACGGIFNVPDGPYPVEEIHKVEYETVAAFGTMCMNDDLAAIIKLNDLCNRSGLDTISAGTVIAFAMECYEKGIISKADTAGIDLTWGNPEAMIALIKKIIAREGIGDMLADGVKVAAQRIGRGAEACAMHVGGQEPGFHSALLLPSRGTGFVCDPTPGRHTAAPMARIEAGGGSVAPYPELALPEVERHAYKGKGPLSATISKYLQVGNCAGLCLFPVIFFGNFPLLGFLNAVTGWEIDMKEALEAGARIQTLRQCFNIREGVKPSEVKLPPRLSGEPPMAEGPLSGITVDIDSLARDYFKAMKWDPHCAVPSDAVLDKLELRPLVEKHG